MPCGADDGGDYPRRDLVRDIHGDRICRRGLPVGVFVTMFIYRDYKWSELPKLMCRTVKTVTIVMILIGFAAAFGAVMTYMQLPMRITEFFTSLSDNKYVILMYLNIMLLLIGTLMDMAPIILILTRCCCR